MLLSKGIRLEDGDEKRGRGSRCLSAIVSFPCVVFASLAKALTLCCSCTKHTDDQVDDDCETLLDGRPVRFPRHAASSFLRTGTPRKMREANDIL
ncbi:hypothetical protein VFPPC_12628 [Pochonia chlamydosporia 170]|uniref:Uncharacterized protein n=1 Tax=Pochonia chlamydosporia 170 TaxID=1380566 RepID=A0A179FBY4_METCM|nr:hypothetical protein VFPPC_12628 [Pochonia chlamydosporia 170]OAQ62994.1 hypothetical protein VFPPC_12628 [Pochonia chlamydosporia 170]